LQQRVLVVDDDVKLVRGMSRILTRQGYHVLTATDVEGALAHAESDRIDAAIIDYTLSRESGLQVLKALRSVHHKCVRILITGRRDPEVFDEAVNQGEINAVLRKPFEGEVLVQMLADAIARVKKQQDDALNAEIEEDENQRKELADAIRQDQLTLALQGIVDVTPGAPQAIVGWEALLRPVHSAFTTPVSLLEQAERYDRVAEVGSAVLAIARTILDALPSSERLFVNLHPAQLGDPERLALDLEPYGVRAGQVVLEITERSRKDVDNEQWEESLKLITARGFALAIDDLGAGYNSLAVLADTNPQFIKIDMQLVRNMHNEPRKQRLVSALRSSGEELGARVIAEGVETAGEAQALLDCGIRWMQGYYYAMPVKFTAGVPPRLP
jgi:EAL domain-containing protein (putative c-di-GMP-specific phosphodiesterase class I)/CheY-like chemotaxis protein